MIKTIPGFTNIDDFVDYKLSLLEKTDKSMSALFGLMFSEEQNTFCETTDGYRIHKVSYGESRERIAKKAAALHCMLKKEPTGSIVGLYMENCLDWLELFWAILKAGYRPLLVNTRIDDDTLERVFAQYCVKAVVSKNKAFGVRNVLLEDITALDCKEDGTNPHDFQNAVLLMSSNTSSHLKICSYTGEQFCCQIKDSSYIIKESMSIKKHYNGELKLLTFLPFYHIFGLVAVYIWFCFFSRTLVLLRDFNPKTIVNTVRKHKVTHIFAVPLFWEKIYKTAIEKIKERGDKTYKKFLRGLKISDSLSTSGTVHKLFAKGAFKEVRENIFGESISFLINGGGYISQDVLRFVNGIGYHLSNGYGMTEIGITSVELSEVPARRNDGSVGRPFHSLQYKINEQGELLVKGKSIADEIYCDGVAQKSGDDWFNTHDLFANENDRYYINGRKDDLIICSNGENINPNIIEPKLMVEGVQRLCIINSDAILLIAEINKYISGEQFSKIEGELNAKIEELNLCSMINKVVFTTSSLLEPNDFKISRKKIKGRYQNGELTLVSNETIEDRVGESDELTERIREIFAKAIGKNVDEITADGHFFFDLGGTSLDYFTMITNIQNEFGIAFPTSMSASISTVRDMASYIRKNMQ